MSHRCEPPLMNWHLVPSGDALQREKDSANVGMSEIDSDLRVVRSLAS